MQTTVYRVVRVVLYLGAVAMMLSLAWKGCMYFDNRNTLAFTLNTKSLPKSVKNVECSGLAITDYVATCIFELDPKDFGRLTARRAFQTVHCDSLPYSEYYATRLAPNLQPTTCLVTYPFARGIDNYEVRHPQTAGHVSVLLDRQRRQALVDIYIE